MSDFLRSIGRKVAVVNLDPANDHLPYEPVIDIGELITLEDACAEFGLGPNGGLMYCMEFLEKNIEWLRTRLEEIQDHYVIFDCPGQVELYTHHESAKNIVKALAKEGTNLTCVHLIDSYYCNSPFTFVSATLLSLNTMLQLELPHVNVFSKIDLVEKYGQLDFSLEYYTEVTNLHHLQLVLDKHGETSEKFKNLNAALCELIEDFSLVSFCTLCVNDKDSMAKLIKIIDRANGFIYTTEAYSDLLNIVSTNDIDFGAYNLSDIKERYMDPEE
jgi:hypothetical protein